MTDDMKPTHMLLFVLCPTLVLGFIYYSSRKLHLPAWGQKTQGAAEESAAAPTKGAEVRAETELETDSTAGRLVGSRYFCSPTRLCHALPQFLRRREGEL
ncbi:unnamed protein product, partial [Tetraodon nigroviridis]